MRNELPKIKPIAKREEILHTVQAINNDPTLKMPEAIEIRRLRYYRYKIVNSI